MADAQRPVVGDPGGAPGIGPLPRVPAEVDPGGRVADLEQRAGHGAALGDDEPQLAAAVFSIRSGIDDWPLLVDSVKPFTYGVPRS
jgi:hypothetical protein